MSKKRKVGGWLLVAGGVCTLAAAILGVGDVQTAMGGLVASLGGVGVLTLKAKQPPTS